MRCEPCRNGHHQECCHSLPEPCDCLVCIAERIGENALSEHPILRDERDQWAAEEK